MAGRVPWNMVTRARNHHRHRNRIPTRPLSRARQLYVRPHRPIGNAGPIGITGNVRLVCLEPGGRRAAAQGERSEP